MDLRRLSSSFCPNSLFFLCNLWEWTGRTGPNNSRTKTSFSSLASPCPALLLSLILGWWCLEGTSQLYVCIGVIVVRNILRVVHTHSGDECFPSGLSLGGIPEGYSDCTPGGIRGKQGFNGEELDIVWDAIRSTPGASPARLGGRTGRDKYGSCIGRDRLSPTREGKLWCNVCLHPCLEQGGMPPVERWGLLVFSLLQKGANNCSLTPLNCMLKNWDRFDPQSLKKIRVIFLCDTACPQYRWEDGERWPVGGSLNYKSVSQLDQFCRKQGTWVEVAYALPFFSPRGMPDLCPKSIDLTVKPSALSCPPLSPYPGLPTEHTESQWTAPHPHPRKGCLGLSKNPSTIWNQDYCRKYQ